ncbi:MAG: biopolymer transporter ExbD, partial [Thermoanaerobaculia bacterium]|nr:biopolymer transporter ExbD [Thermoanaerobaculia bacterium]
MAFQTGSSNVKGEINVTPLVDVVLVLLIIFMVVTPMLQQGVDVKLPFGPHAEKKPGAEDDLVISIKEDGTVFVGQAWVADEDLRAFLAAEYDRNPARNVMFKADARLPFRRVREVMKAANEANFSKIAVM